MKFTMNNSFGYTILDQPTAFLDSFFLFFRKVLVLVQGSLVSRKSCTPQNFLVSHILEECCAHRVFRVVGITTNEKLKESFIFTRGR